MELQLKQTVVVIALDDICPRDPMSHTIHIASVAYNSIFVGDLMLLPDWDIFHSLQSLHPAAECYASARLSARDLFMLGSQFYSNFCKSNFNYGNRTGDI